MESNENEDSSFDSFVNEEDEELNLYQGIMNQKIGKKQIIMSREIKQKLNIVNKLFKEKFGKNFIQLKLESLKEFESHLKTYLFSPQSEFLNHFPNLKRKLVKERKIKEDKLKEKINIGSLLYLSLIGAGSKSNKDRFFKMSKNLKSQMSKNILQNVLYKEKYEKKNKERLDKILFNRDLRKQIQRQSELKKLNENLLPEINEKNNDINDMMMNNIKMEGKLNNRYISRNANSTIKNFHAKTSYTFNENTDNSLKISNPFSTYNSLYQKSSPKFYSRQCKDLEKNLNKCVVSLDGQTKICNKNLIKLINGNWKKNLKKNNKEIINLKKILFDKKVKKPKSKPNNILKIKSLIKKAQLDFDGEVTLEKIRRNELKNFGHYINIMSEDLVLSKVNELYNKWQLKKEGKNFTQDEMERLKKKRQKEEIVEHNRQKIKNNYNKMIQLKIDLSIIKDKFNKTNHRVTENEKMEKFSYFYNKQKQNHQIHL